MANAGGGYRPAVYRPQPPYPRGDGQAPASLLPRGVLLTLTQPTALALPRVIATTKTVATVLVAVLGAFRTFFQTLSLTQSLSVLKRHLSKQSPAITVNLQAR